MNNSISLEELEKQLENRIICDVLNDISRIFRTWNRGGALIHRVRAVGFMAEAGVRNIEGGRTPIKAESTFENMHTLDKKMYSETIEFLYRIVKSGIYSP